MIRYIVIVSTFSNQSCKSEKEKVLWICVIILAAVEPKQTMSRLQIGASESNISFDAASGVGVVSAGTTQVSYLSSVAPSATPLSVPGRTALVFPAHAGWCVLFGEPYQPDPFRIGKLDTRETYVQRYIEICGNKSLDGYTYHMVKVNESGVRVREALQFKAKQAGFDTITEDDRVHLDACLHQLQADEKTYLQPKFEERLRQLCIAEKIHTADGGVSIGDVLASITRASESGGEANEAALKRVKKELGNRDFVRDTVASFFHGIGLVVKITNNKISSEGGIHNTVVIKRPHPNWTGNFYYQVAMAGVVKPLLRKVSSRCEEVKLRVKNPAGQAASADASNPEASEGGDEGRADTMAKADRLIGTIRELKRMMSEAGDTERDMPTYKRMKLALDSVSDSGPVPMASDTRQEGGLTRDEFNSIMRGGPTQSDMRALVLEDVSISWGKAGIGKVTLTLLLVIYLRTKTEQWRERWRACRTYRHSYW